MKTKLKLILICLIIFQAGKAQDIIQELATINSSSQHCSPTFIGLNNTIFFDAGIDFGSFGGVEPWICNTITGATNEFIDLNPGSNTSAPYFITAINNKWFFSADDGTHGLELWITDGTVSGTQLVKDINTGATDGMTQYGCLSIGPVYNNPKNYGVLNNKLFFEGYTGNGEELWVSDGTNAGTTLLKQIESNLSGGSGNYIREFTNVGDKLFFIATSENITTFNLDYDLWVTDGTPSGTMLTKDINLVGNPNPQNLTPFNNKIFFTANDSIHGIELWSSDGTTVGTVMVSDINIGANGSNPSGLYVFNDKLFFLADNGIVGNELWSYDPATDITALVKDTQIGSNGLGYIFNQTTFNNELYFMANTNQLWKTDGTTAGTILVKDALMLDYNATKMVVFTNKLYFGSNYLLWSSDGTTAGTTALPSLPNTTAYTNVQPLTQINGKLIIVRGTGGSAFSSISGGLWTCDSVQNIAFVNSTVTSYGDIYAYNNALYFEADSKLCRYGIPLNLGIENNSKKEFSVFPNPTSSYLTIQSKNQPFQKATITNAIGQTIIKKENLNTSEINLDLSSQSSGMYFLTIENESSKTTQKIIKN
jgi:ELWxxDGT repeat protein